VSPEFRFRPHFSQFRGQRFDNNSSARVEALVFHRLHLFRVAFNYPNPTDSDDERPWQDGFVLEYRHFLQLQNLRKSTLLLREHLIVIPGQGKNELLGLELVQPPVSRRYNILTQEADAVRVDLIQTQDKPL